MEQEGTQAFWYHTSSDGLQTEGALMSWLWLNFVPGHPGRCGSGRGTPRTALGVEGQLHEALREFLAKQWGYDKYKGPGVLETTSRSYRQGEAGET